MAEPTIETLLDVMHDELARLRDKAIAINLVCADLLRQGYYLLAIKDDDAAISRIRVLTHPPVHGLDNLLPGEIVAVVFAGTISYTPSLPESNAAPTPQPEVEPMASPGD